MRECGLLYEPNPNLSFPTLEVSLYEDYESSFSPNHNFMVHTPLTGLEKFIGLPLISLLLVPPSLCSTPRDTTGDDLTLLASPLPLAQCTGLKTGKSSKGDAIFVKHYLLVWSNEPTLIEPFF